MGLQDQESEKMSLDEYHDMKKWGAEEYAKNYAAHVWDFIKYGDIDAAESCVINHDTGIKVITNIEPLWIALVPEPLPGHVIIGASYT